MSRARVTSVVCVAPLIIGAALGAYYAPLPTPPSDTGGAHVTADLIVKSIAAALVILAVVFIARRTRRR